MIAIEIGCIVGCILGIELDHARLIRSVAESRLGGQHLITMLAEPFSRLDIARLGELQISILPSAMMAQFGHAYARAFYRYVAASPYEIVLVRRQSGEIAAFCLVTLSPQTLTKRLLIGTPLLLHAVKRILSPRFWRLVFHALAGIGRHNSEVPAAFAHLPELIIIACDPAVQRQGHGSQLLDDAETALRHRGLHDYMIRTFDDDNNAAVKFYLNRGFISAGRFVDHGTTFRLMRKTLEPHPIP